MLYRHNKLPSSATQQGVVIVIALFIVALVAALAMVMMAGLQRDTERTALIFRTRQASLYAEGAIAWAKAQLTENWQKKNANRVVDIMPLNPTAGFVGGYHIKNTLYDMQGRFNINNLEVKEEQDAFLRLIAAVAPNYPQTQAKELVKAIVDWISLNSVAPELTKYYAHLQPPYRAPHHLMVSVSELRLVKGMTPGLYQALNPYLVALPGDNSPINIQTASAPVLMSLGPLVSKAIAEAIIKIRMTHPFTSLEKFTQLEVIKAQSLPSKGIPITVVSHYFLLTTEVSIEQQQLVLYTLLQRRLNNNKPEIRILWQSKGVW